MTKNQFTKYRRLEVIEHARNENGKEFYIVEGGGVYSATMVRWPTLWVGFPLRTGVKASSFRTCLNFDTTTISILRDS